MFEGSIQREREREREARAESSLLLTTASNDKKRTASARVGDDKGDAYEWPVWPRSVECLLGMNAILIYINVCVWMCNVARAGMSMDARWNSNFVACSNEQNSNAPRQCKAILAIAICTWWLSSLPCCVRWWAPTLCCSDSELQNRNFRLPASHTMAAAPSVNGRLPGRWAAEAAESRWGQRATSSLTTTTKILHPHPTKWAKKSERSRLLAHTGTFIRLALDARVQALKLSWRHSASGRLTPGSFVRSLSLFYFVGFWEKLRRVEEMASLK